MKNYHTTELEAEKTAIQQKIKLLEQELIKINQMLLKAQYKKLYKHNEIITSKSIDRISNEQAILSVIKKYKNGLKTKEILIALENIGIEINYNTLRSYISRMRDKEIIKKDYSNKWIIPSIDE